MEVVSFSPPFSPKNYFLDLEKSSQPKHCQHLYGSVKSFILTDWYCHWKKLFKQFLTSPSHATSDTVPLVLQAVISQSCKIELRALFPPQPFKYRTFPTWCSSSNSLLTCHTERTHKETPLLHRPKGHQEYQCIPPKVQSNRTYVLPCTEERGRSILSYL